MNAHCWSVAAALVFVADGSISTDYARERVLRIEAESELRIESTSRFEREGEPSEFTSTNETKRHVVHVDRVLERDGSTPKKVRRHFVELKHASASVSGDRESSDDRDGALVDVTLDLTRDGDDVKVEVVEGKPEGDALDGHRLELALDALLPSGDVAVGDEWEVDADAVKRALGLDLSDKLFPQPEPDAAQGGERGRGRGRGPGMSAMLLQHAEWECKAKLKEGEEDFDGAACAVIELKIEAKGSVPEPEGGPGGGRSERGLWFANAMPRVENSFEIELEGSLLFDRARRLPVHLELNGKVTAESHVERTWGENTMKIDSESEGELAFEVTVSVEKSE